MPYTPLGFKMLVISFLFLTSWTIELSLAMAEEQTPQKSEKLGESNSSNEIKTNRQAVTELPLVDGRKITIHAEAKSADISKPGTVYFHKPIFAFRENPDVRKNQPSIIWDTEETEDYVFVQVRLVLTTKEIIKLAKAQVIEHGKSLQGSSQTIEEKDVEVRGWPLKRLRLTIKHNLTDEEFGEGLSDNLSRVDGLADLSLKIPKKRYDRFKSQLLMNRIKFIPSHTFSNTIEASGNASTQISSEVSQEVTNILNSAGKEPGGPIFQEDVKSLKEKLRQSITQTISGTDQRILAHIKTLEISNHILKPKVITFESMQDKGKGALLDSVNEYLAATVKKLHKDKSSSTTDTKEKEKTKKKKLSVGSKTGGSASLDVTDREKNILEKKHGFKFTENKDTIEPHSIEINFVRDSWQENIQNIVQKAYLAMGVERSFQEDSPFKGSFTLTKLQESLGEMTVAAIPFSGFLKGMAVCSFRDEIPSGFIPLDGTTEKVFPEDKWVPKHLWKQKLPNLANRFVRGVDKAEDTGLERLGGEIMISGHQIPASSFKLKPKGSVGVFKGDGVGDNNFLGLLGKQRNGPAYFENGLALFSEKKKLLKNDVQIFATNVYDPHTLKREINIPSQTIDLTKDSAQPNNIGCRWIMRID